MLSTEELEQVLREVRAYESTGKKKKNGFK